MTNILIVVGFVLGAIVGNWIHYGAPWWLSLIVIPYGVLVYYSARKEKR